MLLAFNEFVFDEEQWELRKANTVLRVQPKLLKLLLFFLKHSGKLLSKQKLLDEVWEGCVLSDNVLSVSVARLRKVLGRQDGEREYIVNVVGRGYRFVSQVTSIEPNEIETDPSFARPHASAERAPLVGRDLVLRRLNSALARADVGRGGICVLVGEPGIGKTRVVESMERRSTAFNALWAWAHCHSMESDPPLWLWTQILREYLHTGTVYGSDDSVGKSPVKSNPSTGPTRTQDELADSLSTSTTSRERVLDTGLADEIRHVLNERISELTRFSEQSDRSTELGNSASMAGHRAFDEIIRVLKRLSEQWPLVAVLDDLQWADAASLRLLSYLVTEIARWPMLVVATLRTTELGPKDSRNKHLYYVLGHRNCERIVLDRLSEAAVGNYVTALFGDVEADFSRAVFEKSEGNPFYMVELLRPCVHSNRPHVEELGLSTFALDIVRQRVRKQNCETRGMLSAAAVLGRDFDLSMLSYVMERSEDTLLDLLKHPLADGTVVNSSEGQRRYAFSHELIREVLYEDLNATERKLWHLRAGECLEKRRNSGSEVATARLAHHFLSALPRSDVAKAVAYADSAAREAMRFFAYADAAAWLHRAIQTLKLEVHSDLQLLCRLLLNFSSAARATGDGRYLDYLNKAIALATEHGFGRLLAMAGLTLNLAPGMPAMPGALRVLEAAEQMLLDEDKQERAMVLTHLAWTPPNCMNTGRVNELLTRAMALARDSGSLLAITTVLRGKLFFSGGPADYLEAQAVLDELERLARSELELWLLPSLDIQLFRIISAIQRGDTKPIQRAIETFGAIAREAKTTLLVWHNQRMDMVRRMNAGEFDGVSDELSQLRERAEGIGFHTGRLLCDIDLGALLSQTADMRLFTAEFREWLPFNESDVQSIWALKIQIMVRFGLLMEAEAALRRFNVAQIRELPVDLSYLATLVRLVVGSIAVGAKEYVSPLYELLEPYPEYYAVDIYLHCEGSVSYYLGLLARTLNRHREAIAHLEDALEHNDRFNLKAHLIRTRYELARTLADNSSRSEQRRARSLLQQALDDARKLGICRQSAVEPD